MVLLYSPGQIYYWKRKRETGVKAALQSLVHRHTKKIPAVENISFDLTHGEIVGFLGPLLSKPVRNLSLGERMKCKIAASLLHRPSVVFLNEPTIGLDVIMQRRRRGSALSAHRRYPPRSSSV